MPRRRARRLFRVEAVVDPEVLPQVVEPARPADELPHASGAGARNCAGLERALDHREVDHVLGDPLLGEDGPDHVLVAALPVERRLEPVVPALLVHLDDGLHPGVQDDRDVVGDLGEVGRRQLLGRFELRQVDVGELVDRGLVGLLERGAPFVGGEERALGVPNRLQDLFVECLGLGARGHPARQVEQQVDRAVERSARAVPVGQEHAVLAGLELLARPRHGRRDLLRGERVAGRRRRGFGLLLAAGQRPRDDGDDSEKSRAQDHSLS